MAIMKGMGSSLAPCTQLSNSILGLIKGRGPNLHGCIIFLVLSRLDRKEEWVYLWLRGQSRAWRT